MSRVLRSRRAARGELERHGTCRRRRPRPSARRRGAAHRRDGLRRLRVARAGAVERARGARRRYTARIVARRSRNATWGYHVYRRGLVLRIVSQQARWIRDDLVFRGLDRARRPARGTRWRTPLSCRRIVATDVSGLQPGARAVISAGYGGRRSRAPPIDAGSAGAEGRRSASRHVAESDVTVTLEKDGAPAGDAALLARGFTQNATDFQKSRAIGARDRRCHDPPRPGPGRRRRAGELYGDGRLGGVSCVISRRTREHGAQSGRAAA